MPGKIRLDKLLAPDHLVTQNLCVASMTLDSRKVTNGTLFVALQGAQLDGRKFIDSAIKAGAVAVLSETKNKASHGQQTYQNNVLIIKVYQLSIVLSSIAYRFYFNE